MQTQPGAVADQSPGDRRPDDKRSPCPIIRAFYATRDPDVIDPVDVTITEHLAGDQIVALEAPERWFAGDWSALSGAVLARRRAAELRPLACPLAKAS